VVQFISLIDRGDLIQVSERRTRV